MTVRTALAAVIAAAFILSGSVAAQTIQLPKSKTEVLANGLKVTLAEQHTVPLIEVRMRIPAGIAYEPEGKEGLARLTAELLTQGTAKHSATEIATALDQIGATLRTAATPDYLLVSMSTLARHRSAALKLLAECIVEPTFPDPEVERIRSRQLAMLDQQGEDPAGLADVALWTNGSRAIPTDGVRTAGNRRSPRSRPPRSAISTRRGSSPEARSWWRSAISRRGRCGRSWPSSFPAGRADRPHRCRRRYGGSGATRHRPSSSSTNRSSFRARSGSAIRDSRAAMPTRRRCRWPRRFSAADSRPASSKRSASNGASAICQLPVSPGRADGRGGVATATKTPTTRQTMDVALTEVERLVQEGPGDEELAGVKSYLSGSIARSLQSPADIAQSLSAATFYGLPEDYLARRLEKIQAVGKPDLQRVTGEHFTPSGRTIVVVTDATAVRDSLAGLGTVKEVRFESLLE